MAALTTGKVRNGLYKRGSSWYILAKVKQPNGTWKQIRKSFGTDKRAAELALAELKKQRVVARVNNDWSGLEQLTAPKSQKTFAEVAAEYMAERAHNKASTLRQYNELLNGYLLPQFADVPISAITEQQVAQLQVRLANRLSACRTNSAINLLRAILKVCVRRKLIEENPAAGVDRLREAQTNIDPLTVEELGLALSKVGDHYRPLFTCLAWTGARPCELLALRWNDVDFARKEIRINKARVRGAEGLPKTSSSERVIPMLPPVIEALQALKGARNVVALNGNDHVFLRKDGKAFDKGLDTHWATALQRAGLRHRPSYQLRHTFASICFEQGVSAAWVSKVLGHTTLQTTFRHYARFIKDPMKQNEQIMASMFTVSPISPLSLSEEKSANR